MSRFVWAGTMAVVVGLWAGAGRAAAQPPGPPRLGSAPLPPGYSPYLNLVRGGSPAVNYYGIVRPQQNFQAAIQGLQAQQILTAAGAGAADGSELPGTGIPTQFMNHHVFFMNLGMGGTGFGTGMTTNRPVAGQFPAGVQAPARPAPRTR